ncbi:MAG: cytidylate kinase-like family protein [Lachnospiraceae bacterium]|nr:cytidylate kinase-like family protein [Lachnospiraceae bacterium]
MNRIITVSREFGSGGREFGKRLAEQYVEQLVEKKPVIAFPIHIGRSFYPPANPVLEQTKSVVLEQQRIIKELAEKSDCVIVGRCADYILREYDPFRFFVYADMESKLKRCHRKAPGDEHLTDKELKRKIALIDKNRAAYYDFWTGGKWGLKLNYDLCINTTHTAIKEIAAALSKMF